MNRVCYSIKIFFAVGMFVVFCGMMDCGDVRKMNTTGEPNFVALKEGQGNYEAIITDELARIEVKEISFSGITKIGGILYEENDATGILEIESLLGKTIKVLEDNYKSLRYPEKNLFKAKIVGTSNASAEQKSISNLQDVEICGIDKSTGKTLFKAEILDGKNISVIKNAEFSGIDKKTGKTLFNAKVVEVSEHTQEKNINRKSDESDKYILIPRDIVVCGIDKKTGASMAWFMRKIDSIEFKRPESTESSVAKIDAKFKEALTKTKK